MALMEDVQRPSWALHSPPPGRARALCRVARLRARDTNPSVEKPPRPGGRLGEGRPSGRPLEKKKTRAVYHVSLELSWTKGRHPREGGGSGTLGKRPVVGAVDGNRQKNACDHVTCPDLLEWNKSRGHVPSPCRGRLSSGVPAGRLDDNASALTASPTHRRAPRLDVAARPLPDRSRFRQQKSKHMVLRRAVVVVGLVAVGAVAGVGPRRVRPRARRHIDRRRSGDARGLRRVLRRVHKLG